MELGSEGWLERVAATSADSRMLAATYDEWSAHYDADMLSTGYPNLAVCAALAGRHVPVAGSRVLDAGAGTGMLGVILAAVGFTDLVGIDISPGMLERARRRGVYRDLQVRALGEPLDFAGDSFTAVTAMGVFAFGHAPAHALEELVRVTRPGGCLIFNVNAAPWEEAGFRDEVERLEAAGRWEPVEVAGPYQPMPLSPTRGHVTSRAFVYRVR
jgi:SAM-dependent methyltransferase